MSDYPLLDIFWTILWFYFVFAFFMILFRVIVDLFSNKELGGVAKAIWLIVLLFLPVLGTLIYLVSQGDQMAARGYAAAKQQDDAFREYVQSAAGTSGPGDQLAQLVALRDQGHLTEAEFQSAKAKILA